MVEMTLMQTPKQKNASRKYFMAKRLVVFIGLLTIAVVTVPLALSQVADNAKLLGYDHSFATALLWMAVTVGLGYSSINTLQKVGLAVTHMVGKKKGGRE